MAPRIAATAAMASFLAACGGGGGGATQAQAPATATADGAASAIAAPVVPGAGNVVAIRVDRGPNGRAVVNSPFVSVTLCVPGTTTCQQVDHVLLDTGSSGLRLRAAALVPSLALPAATLSGAPVAQCMQFASGFAWGAVRQADVVLAGERAGRVAVQVVDDALAGTAPAACSDRGPSIVTRLDANGILGVGAGRQDCGAPCDASAAPGVYFACAAGACTAAAMPRAAQVANPVASFARHNNGVAVALPVVPAGGAASLTGALLLGIGTADNNQLDGAQVLPVDARGFVRSVYQGVALDAFLDTGTNGLFFPDAALPRCGSFYCPPAPAALSAAFVGPGGVAWTADFLVDALATLRGDAVAASLGGPAIRSFQWGLPFFFGRTVFVGLDGAESAGGTGPFWAF